MAVNCCVAPRAIVGVSGVIAIETSAAGVTTSGAVALIDSQLTPIVVVPALSALASPAAPAVSVMVAAAAVDELQCPVCVRFWVVPSVKVPVAVNCWVVPKATVAVGGVIAIETSAADDTVSTVELLTVPEAALMVAVPMPTLCASPALVMVTVDGVPDDHVAVLVKFCVLPSENVPVAVNCCCVPRAIVGVGGVIARETSTAGVTVTVVEPATAPELAVIVVVPAPTLVAKPCVGAALLMVATAGVSELH